MKKTLLPTLTFLLILMLSACNGQATQTPLESAASTEALSQPTQVPASTITSIPSSTTSDASGTASPAPAAAAAISFANDVMPIFESRCIKCHGGEQTKEGLDLKTYEGLMAGSFNGTVLEPGNAGASFLVEQLLTGEMPKRGTKLTPSETQIIADWINSGAINN